MVCYNYKRKTLALVGSVFVALATEAVADVDTDSNIDDNPDTEKGHVTLGSETRFHLPGAGGSGPFETVKDWIAAFEAKYPEVELSISSVGSGAAQAALWGDVNCEKKPVEGVCDDEASLTITRDKTVWGIGGSTIDEELYVEHEALGLQTLPALGGPVLVTYSKDVTGDLGSKASKQLNLSPTVIAGIFNNTIRYWDDPAIKSDNSAIADELPSEPITIVVRSDKSGMTETLTQFVEYTNPTWPDEAVGKKPEWPLANISHSSESAVCSSVCAEPSITNIDEEEAPRNFMGDGQTGIGIGLLRRPFSVGYLELGYFSTLTQFVAQAHVSSAAHPTAFEAATVETLKTTMDGLANALDPTDLSLNMVTQDTPMGGYPISRYANWYIKKSPEQYDNCYQAWLIYTFIEWTYRDPLAAEVAAGHGWIVPPTSVVEKALEKLREIQCILKEEDGAFGDLAVGDVIWVTEFTPSPYREISAKSSSSSTAVVLVPSILVALLVVAAIGAYIYIQRNRRQADVIWSVKKSELSFGAPPEIIGRGTFGLVLLAEYRGTPVAVKRVIPPRAAASGGKRDTASVETKRQWNPKSSQLSPGQIMEKMFYDRDAALESGRSGRGPEEAAKSSHSGVGVLISSESTRLRSGRASLKSGTWFDKFKHRDEYAKLKADFTIEMRYLSKLRHPCITTVMGAVLKRGEEPLLVMEYMDHGSLYDILHNETAPLDGDLLLPILRDITQGIRFLHAATPQVIHGDLKAQNVLVDSKFRAKVADFGLSAKKAVGATGTPLWMAPELLRGESFSSAASDVYSLGIVLYEVYSRKEPYHGENALQALKGVVDPEINKRPPIPPACPSQVAAIMKDCWHSDPDKRPTSEEIDQRLKRLEVENVEPGEMHLSAQRKKILKASRSEDLLFNVFPKHIAEALRDGRKVEPEYREMVTIFFSDIVGFTNISASVSPEKVSDMLDRLYQRFDDLSYVHEVFKIETIGDAYVCVTNLVKDQDDHVKRIAEFSMDAIQAARETLVDLDDPSKGYVNIRVGFHSGSVIANVVGSRLPKYSMFGDTINTAARMESNSLPGRIHCSKKSADLLAEQSPHLTLTSRGKIKIKGKGEMHTFWVNEEIEQSPGSSRV